MQDVFPGSYNEGWQAHLFDPSVSPGSGDQGSPLQNHKSKQRTERTAKTITHNMDAVWRPRTHYMLQLRGVAWGRDHTKRQTCDRAVDGRQ